MSELLNESRISLPQLARSQNVHPTTVWRWALRGVRGCVLETFSIGGRRFTTLEALERFVAATTAVAKGESPLPPRARTSKQRQKAIERAERELDAFGI